MNAGITKIFGVNISGSVSNTDNENEYHALFIYVVYMKMYMSLKRI